MAKKKQTGLPTKWFVVAGVIFVFLIAIFSAWKINPPKQLLRSGAYQLYQNAEYGFRVEYPNTWDVKYDTQVFENGDVVAFQIKGPTQKRYTEFIDGARFIVSKPFYIDTDLSTWIKRYFTGNVKFSRSELGDYIYEEVEDCSHWACMRYLFIKINNKAYGVYLFAEGGNEEKAMYENALIHMLKSLKFTDSPTSQITEDEAIARVKSLSEVVDYLKRVPNGLVSVNGKEDNSYLVQVFEMINGHTATFNWYKVDKTTGEVKKEF